MIKMLFCLMAITSLAFLSCTSPKQEEAPKKGNGYTDVETENVNLVKQLNEASLKYDSAAMQSFYSSNLDTIHNNLDPMTVAQYQQLLGSMQKAGITAKIESYPSIWETINDKPSAKGVTNYVVAYMILNIGRGTKTAKVLYNQVCAFKDGKVVEEWDVYDSKPFEDIMK